MKLDQPSTSQSASPPTCLSGTQTAKTNSLAQGKLVIYFGGAPENVICVHATCGKQIQNKAASQ